MENDIIAHLEANWEKNDLDFGEDYKRYDFSLTRENGHMEYHPNSKTLYIWSGLGLSDCYGYEVKIRDLKHLQCLERLL